MYELKKREEAVQKPGIPARIPPWQICCQPPGRIVCTAPFSPQTANPYRFCNRKKNRLCRRTQPMPAADEGSIPPSSVRAERRL